MEISDFVSIKIIGQASREDPLTKPQPYVVCADMFMLTTIHTMVHRFPETLPRSRAPDTLYQTPHVQILI